MNHDPLCTWTACTHGSTHCRCGDCQCDLIAKVELRTRAEQNVPA